MVFHQRNVQLANLVLFDTASKIVSDIPSLNNSTLSELTYLSLVRVLDNQIVVKLAITYHFKSGSHHAMNCVFIWHKFPQVRKLGRKDSPDPNS